VDKVTFIERNDTEHIAQFRTGMALMQTAVEYRVPAIDADCGGSCACGTCHVIVSEERFGEAGKNERQMLEMKPERGETSRLARQVETTEAMDDLVVRLPEYQM
jgi:2Fe-2S ferredoxin